METIWKGPITFCLISFPVRLQKAARKERMALRYVRETNSAATAELDSSDTGGGPDEDTLTSKFGHSQLPRAQGELIPVRQGRKSLETAVAANAQRKPAAHQPAADGRPRKRKA